jgi:predicted nucleotide-binding protein
MRAAIARFKRRLAELADFDPKTVQERSDPKVRKLEVAIDEALSEAFGHRTPEYSRYSAATNLDTATISMGRRAPPSEIVQGLIRGKERAVALLESAVQFFEEKLADLGDTGEAETTGAALQTDAPSRDVFIVHGRDELAKQEVARLIERAGLRPVILHEQANIGRTIIEKFEDYGGAAGFAVVLLTPDDVGGPTDLQLQPRARQNVIGEMFWFAGKLGRKRVCALRKDNIEIPTDFAGVVYTDMDDKGAWKAELLRELQAAGYAVDWANAMA